MRRREPAGCSMQSPRIFATVVVIKLARIIWAERLNERPDSQATVMSLRPASRIAGLSKRRIRERLRIVTTAAMIMTMMATITPTATWRRQRSCPSSLLLISRSRQGLFARLFQLS